METLWTKALKDSISEVFATMFFMVLDEEPTLAAALGSQPVQGWFAGHLEVSQAGKSVRMMVWSSPQLTGQLAANMLSGDAAELAEGQILDAHREMLNMVAGSVLTKIDKEGSWKMGLPHSRKVDKGSLAELLAEAPATIGFSSDEQPLFCGVQVTGN